MQMNVRGFELCCSSAMLVPALDRWAGERNVATQWEREQRKLQEEAEFNEREEVASERNSELEEKLTRIESTLVAGIQNAPDLDYDKRLREIPDAGSVADPRREREPRFDDYTPRFPSFLGRTVPGWERRYESKCDEARLEYEAAHTFWANWTEQQNRAYAERVAEVKAEAAAALAENELLRKHQSEVVTGTQRSVEDYVRWALHSSRYEYKVTCSVRYLPSRKELLLEVQYPNVDEVIPSISKWVHVKVRKSVETKDRTKEDRNRLYKRLIAQITIRSMYECFHIDAPGHINRISFKGVVEGTSPITGRLVRPPVVSVRVERSTFLDRDFTRVDAVKLLQSFRANFSNEPTELKPIPLIVEFDVSDPRLIEEEDVLSKLDDRDNLIDLTAAQFEAVITNLFNRMGYEAYPTVRSKDGGVDCIAYFRDPVGVMKYVVQAKKWTGPVGVDAVRDLAGAMDHERASKGILVTTSRVAPAGKKFVEGKPMQLIEGEELLDLIQKYTDHRVTIIFPPK
jgi:restriction system protein